MTPYQKSEKDVLTLLKTNSDTIIKSNFEATLDCPGYVLSINHRTKEYDISDQNSKT